MALTVSGVSIAAEWGRLNAFRLEPSASVLPDFGLQLLLAADWFMPVVGGSILTAYVALLPSARGSAKRSHASTPEKVIPWICMGASLAAILWVVFGAFGLFRDPSETGTFLGCLIVAALAAAFGSLAGATLPRDPQGALQDRRQELAEIQALERGIRGAARLTRPAAFAVLGGWVVLGFVIPAGTFAGLVGSAGLLADNSRDAFMVMASLALMLLFVPAGASAFRGPYVLRPLEIVFGIILYIIGVGMYLVAAAIFAETFLQGPLEWRAHGLRFSASLALVACLMGFLTLPGISIRYRWLRWWSPDAAVLALTLARYSKTQVRLSTEIRKLEDEISQEKPDFGTRLRGAAAALRGVGS
jgi:hypothetical protein